MTKEGLGADDFEEMSANIFRGCIPALMTPCDASGAPNYDALVATAKRLVEVGMRGVVYCGSMGDWPLLTNEQRQEGVSRLAKAGVPVLGICNGFQVLTECGLLPGALMRNAGLKFVCKDVHLSVEETESVFTGGYEKGQVIRIPIAHHDGNYIADDDTLDRVEGEGRVAFRYRGNPNGSARDIAGVLSENGRILGLMPHPERAIGGHEGGSDGRGVFESLLAAL